MKLLQKDEDTISYEMTDIRNNPDYIRYEGQAYNTISYEMTDHE